MKERPILFSGAMVRAIDEDRKTQTRRVVKAIPEAATEIRLNDRGFLESFVGDIVGVPRDHEIAWAPVLHPEHGCEGVVRCPYGVPGDRLWVRETWCTRREWDGCSPKGLPLTPADLQPGNWQWLREQYVQYMVAPEANGMLHGKTRVSIHMPRWACRFELEVVSVRVERLQEISEEDAIAEGVTVDESAIIHGSMGRAQFAFADLWEEINGKRSWELNPWVWVVGFRKVGEKERHSGCEAGQRPAHPAEVKCDGHRPPLHAGGAGA